MCQRNDDSLGPACLSLPGDATGMTPTLVRQRVIAGSDRDLVGTRRKIWVPGATRQAASLRYFGQATTVCQTERHSCNDRSQRLGETFYVLDTLRVNLVLSAVNAVLFAERKEHFVARFQPTSVFYSSLSSWLLPCLFIHGLILPCSSPSRAVHFPADIYCSS